MSAVTMSIPEIFTLRLGAPEKHAADRAQHYVENDVPLNVSGNWLQVSRLKAMLFAGHSLEPKHQ